MPETLIFEPHSLFRHEPIEGEEFPFGYISKAQGQPIFALHEAFVDAPVEELARIARLIAAAPDAIRALELALEYWAHRQQRYRNRAPVWVAAARAAISKATSRQPEGER